MFGLKFTRQHVICEEKKDGIFYVHSPRILEPHVRNTGVWLEKWASETPNATFLAERDGEDWLRLSYEDVLTRIQRIAAYLLSRGLGPDRPIAILSSNSLEHALIVLAAHYVGIPTAAIAEQYSLIKGAHSRLIHVLGLVKPALVYVEDAGRFADALALDELKDVEIVAKHTEGTSRTVIPYESLFDGFDEQAVRDANAKVGPDTIAKYLFTSGSTGGPKGVVTTQKMMCVNQEQIREIWPFLTARAPRVVDWLPWNHVFGGTHNINMMLANGGAYYIDHGRPTPKGFAESIRNIREIGQTISVNVPAAYAMLAKEMDKDLELRRAFFADQDILFYAGASLPSDIWEQLKALSIKECGRAPSLISGWGATETAPTTMMVHEEIDESGKLGVPVAGVTIKLIPDDTMRCELRVKGPNVMTSYLNDPERTEKAFDEEGYFITGDALRFVDQNDPSRGFRFDGRISEDFKLLTGTWVHVSKLRLSAMEYLNGVALDVVITGQDKNDIGMLVFPDLQGLEKAGISVERNGDALISDDLQVLIKSRLHELQKLATGSSTKICRALVLSEPASIGEGEITDKGNINQRKVQSLRLNAIMRLYDDTDCATFTL